MSMHKKNRMIVSMALFLIPLFCCVTFTHAAEPVRIGFVDPALPKATPALNAAALAFARSQGEATRLSPQVGGGWRAADGRVHAPEEFDVLWFHQADDLAALTIDEAGRSDLTAWLEGGGVLLLSGAAGRWLNDLGIEPTPLRVLGANNAAVVSGFQVVEKHGKHPVFAGLDTSKPVLLTSKGNNALADFYGTQGPHGELLANGSGTGERPLVEYTVGAGRVIFVGWRLADFMTATDEYRPNLEKLFGNILRYLSSQNTNHATLVVPEGKSRYERRMGIPFLCAEKTETFGAKAKGFKTAVLLLSGNGADGISENRIVGDKVSTNVLGLTLTSRELPLARFLADRRAEQEKSELQDKEKMAGLCVVKPEVSFLPAPLKPLQAVTNVDQSVLLGRSHFMAPGDGRDAITPIYEPVEDGGFRITGGKRRLNRPIVHGQNRVWTGDVPVFRMDTVTGNGSYANQERVFPLWPRPDGHIGDVNPCMGTLRLGMPGAGGATNWLDELPGITTTFRPGYTEYQREDVRVTIAPALDVHGLICRVEFQRETALIWQYGGISWKAGEADANQVEIAGGIARIAEANLPNGLVLAGWDGEGDATVMDGALGKQAAFVTKKPRRVYHIVAAWGVMSHDEEKLRKTLARLDTPNTAAWPEAREKLKKLWFDCYVGRALEPEKHFRRLLAAPSDELKRTCAWWDSRRAEFQIKTPDARLNALINWARCVSEYHRQGPGLVLGGQIWQMYSHISTGWYGKQWAGDHEAMEECLRFYGAMQGDDGFVRWISPSLVAFTAENNTAYWVDQVWRHYTWTGDKQFVRDLWPGVKRAVAWMCANNDRDGDGLFRDYYEYWNCDSNGKGPKAAAPSAMSCAMLDRAARLAAVVGDGQSETEYRAQAEKTRAAIFRELWNEREGRLGSIGADGIWRGHPQIWEEYLAINAGVLDAEKGRRAMRWVAAHYGFEPQPGVQLLACSDWWPIRWSCQWVPTGDSCLAALAGMKCGDVDLWWPYLKTVVGSAFQSECPGINMGISNAGAGGGEIEDVDSDDPHMHVAVRGLFGIEPALNEGRLDICPAFPSAWREAGIRTPDIRYEWHREGNQATFRIRTPKPVIKHVRASLDGPEIVTPSEVESVVTVQAGPAAPPQEPVRPPPILAEQQPVAAPKPLGDSERKRLVLFDLAASCNVTVEEFVATQFTFDYADGPSPLSSWWGNPALTMPLSPRVVTATNGVLFLTSGRPRPGLGTPPKNLLALASWQPYPLPGGVVVKVGQRCGRVWLLLQNYVHPMKNYLPNGEVVLNYAKGQREIIPLVPPFNLDCYFQHFSREGVPVPMGQLSSVASGWTPIAGEFSSAHADALEIVCDTNRELESIELRATCSEGVLGLAGMTALAAEK